MPPETIDSLDDDLKPMVLRIVAQNASLLGRIDELLAQNAKVHAQNVQLLSRIADLEAKLGGQFPLLTFEPRQLQGLERVEVGRTCIEFNAVKGEGDLPAL